MQGELINQESHGVNEAMGSLHLQKGQHVASSKPVATWPHDKLEKSSWENLLFSYRRC